MKILVLVPARGGSKGLPGKNLLRVGGMSLVARAITVGREFLRACGHSGTVLLDTDSEEIAAEGRRFGAAVPFLRPPELAEDETPTLDSTLVALERIEALEGRHDVVVLLQPTSPLRNVDDVLTCFGAYEPNVGSVVSIVATEHAPEQTLRLVGGTVSWAWPELSPSSRRQAFPDAWRASGAVYVASADVLRTKRSFLLPGLTRGVPLPVARSVDVDTRADLEMAESLLRWGGSPDSDQSGGRIKVALIGAGEHGRVVLEAARTRPDAYEILGFFDPQPCDETVRRFGVARLGAEPELADYPGALGIVGVGAVGVSGRRAEVVARAGAAARWATIVHARAWVAPTATLGEGTVVLGGAIVNSGARIGRHVIVNSGAVVEHDVELGDFVQVSPGAVIAGGTRIGTGSYVGLGASVRDHVAIGEGVFVAMGAAVVSDLPNGASVRGVPAR